jgi:hypothetical protein
MRRKFRDEDEATEWANRMTDSRRAEDFALALDILG